MIMSSDKYANIREPLAVVEFQLETENGPKLSTLEMNKHELKTFIDSLEAANKVCHKVYSASIFLYGTSI